MKWTQWSSVYTSFWPCVQVGAQNAPCWTYSEAAELTRKKTSLGNDGNREAEKVDASDLFINPSPLLLIRLRPRRAAVTKLSTRQAPNVSVL